MQRTVAYALIGIMSGACALLVAILEVAISPIVAATVPTFGLLWLGGIVAPRIGWTRISVAMEAMALVYLANVAVLVLLFCLTAVSAPLADSTLARADAALGLDWRAYVALFDAAPAFIRLSLPFYRMLSFEPAVLIALLSFLGLSPWRFAAAWLAALSICCLVYPFGPALGSYIHFGVRNVGGIENELARGFGPVIEAIKGGERNLTPERMVGFVSFPSFHTAAGIICILATWPIRWARWPFLAANSIMIAASPLFGGHYLVDLLAGAAVGWLAWAVTGRLKLATRAMRPIHRFLRTLDELVAVATGARLEGLDALRGLAAVIVAVNHARYVAGLPSVLDHSFLAVDFFFLLSGFILARTYEHRMPSPATFLMMRYKRLWAPIALGC